MNFRKSITLIFLLITLGSLGPVFAHEGHDSALAKSLYGGIVKKTANTFVEVVQDEGIEIYINDHDYKNLVAPTLEVTAMADVKGKKIPLKLEQKKNHFLVITDLKKEKHFKLNVSMKFKNKWETVAFPLEN